jgi:hypothetical protein
LQVKGSLPFNRFSEIWKLPAWVLTELIGVITVGFLYRNQSRCIERYQVRPESHSQILVLGLIPALLAYAQPSPAERSNYRFYLEFWNLTDYCLW